MSANTKQINTLNKLITTLYDGENGYKEAAKEVESVTLVTRFRQLAQQRYDLGHELKPLIRQFGGEVAKGGSILANIHRTWMDLKSTVASNDEAAIINECIRGEEAAIEAYEEALKCEELSSSAREVVSRQKDKISQTLNNIRIMSYAYATV